MRPTPSLIPIVLTVLAAGCAGGPSGEDGNSDPHENDELTQWVDPFVTVESGPVGAKGLRVHTGRLVLAESRETAWPAVLAAAVNNFPVGNSSAGYPRYSAQDIVDDFLGGQIPRINATPHDIAASIAQHFRTVPREEIPTSHFTVWSHELHKPQLEVLAPPLGLRHFQLDAPRSRGLVRHMTILQTKGSDGLGLPLLLVSIHWSRDAMGLRTLETLRVWDPTCGERLIAHSVAQDSAHPDCVVAVVNFRIWSGIGRTQRLMTREEIDARTAKAQSQSQVGGMASSSWVPSDGRFGPPDAGAGKVE